MKDKIKKHLIDILHAAEEIELFVSGMDFAAYKRTRSLNEQLREILKLLVKLSIESGKLMKNFLKIFQNIIELSVLEISLYMVMTSLMK